MTFLSTLCFAISAFFLFDLFHGVRRKETRDLADWLTILVDVLGVAFFLWLGDLP